MFTIENDEQNIIKTNYWDSEHAKQGYMFMSVNAGCIRLLVPQKMAPDLKDMAVAKSIIIQRGKWPEQNNREAILITFDDGSDLPYITFITIEQCDRLLNEKKIKTDFAIYTENGLYKKWNKCNYEKVDVL